jgi:hypothetical protein
MNSDDRKYTGGSYSMRKSQERFCKTILTMINKKEKAKYTGRIEGPESTESGFGSK